MKDRESQFCWKAPLDALASIILLIPVALLPPIVVSAIMGSAGREHTA